MCCCSSPPHISRTAAKLAASRAAQGLPVPEMSDLSLAGPSHDTLGDGEESDDDEEFFDAAPDHSEAATSPALPSSSSPPAATATNGSVVLANSTSGGVTAPKRRTKLPAVMFDRSNVSLWTVIKDFVGKDLSKIAVPVYFNEPLSFLQKFSEDLEYYQLLDQASKGTSTEARAQRGCEECL